MPELVVPLVAADAWTGEEALTGAAVALGDPGDYLAINSTVSALEGGGARPYLTADGLGLKTLAHYAIEPGNSLACPAFFDITIPLGFDPAQPVCLEYDALIVPDGPDPTGYTNVGYVQARVGVKADDALMSAMGSRAWPIGTKRSADRTGYSLHALAYPGESVHVSKFLDMRWQLRTATHHGSTSFGAATVETWAGGEPLSVIFKVFGGTYYPNGYAGVPVATSVEVRNIAVTFNCGALPVRRRVSSMVRIGLPDASRPA